MLKDIEQIRVPFKIAREERYLCFNLNATLYLEHYFGNTEELMAKDSSLWNYDEVLHLLRAGLMDSYFEENEKSISNRKFEDVKPSIASLGRILDVAGVQQIAIRIVESIISSFPAIPVGADENF